MEVGRLISEIENKCEEKLVSLAWVKAYIRIDGNEEADTEVKGAASDEGGRVMTEGGIRVWLKEIRREERVVSGFGIGRVVQWNSCYAVLAYSQIRTGKGLQRACRKKIGKSENGDCNTCRIEGNGTHGAISCMAGKVWGWRWSMWGQIDEIARCRRV